MYLDRPLHLWILGLRLLLENMVQGLEQKIGVRHGAGAGPEGCEMPPAPKRRSGAHRPVEEVAGSGAQGPRRAWTVRPHQRTRLGDPSPSVADHSLRGCLAGAHTIEQALDLEARLGT